MTTLRDLSAFIEGSPDHEWVGLAACASLNIDQLDHFFVEAGRTLSRQAALICLTCPVRRNCLQYSYDNDITAGYFGGMSPSKRRTMTCEQALESLGS